LVGIDVPDRDGRFANVTLHLDDRNAYLEKRHPVFGSTIGRYANRVDTGGFTIDGTRFDLATVNPKTRVHIHGGRTGFQWQNWRAEPLPGSDSAGVRLSLVSPDGHEGYPGTLRVELLVRLDNRDQLSFDYSATTDKPTHVNLTNHAYWNLGGAGSGPVLDHRLTIRAASRLEFDDRKVPTGTMVPVADSPFDFRRPRAIGSRIGGLDGGYDHCYVLATPEHPGQPRLAARVEDPASGRVMEVLTTTPGLQLYTANHLSDKLGAGGRSYGPHHALCLECQHFPDSPNHAAFPTTLLRPGQTYRQLTIHRFATVGR
jgi:aldose 1-epimerase